MSEIRASIMLLQEQGRERCAAMELLHEVGKDLADAVILDVCALDPIGYLPKLGSGICSHHHARVQKEGALILE